MKTLVKSRWLQVFSCILCMILLLQALCACNGGTDAPSETTGSQGDTETSTTLPSVAPSEYSGYLNDYTLVRGTVKTCPEAICVVQLLEKELSEAIGKEIKSQVDTRGKDSAETKEILLGITNRSASEKANEDLQKDEFSITVDGNKIVIVGDNALALDRAVDYFIANCIYGISSVQDLKDYREQRKDEAIELSELSEFGYTEPTCIYFGGIQQDFAIDFPTGDIYYSTIGGYNDSTICRVTPSGHQEYMIINNFGHVETMEIERVGEKVYIWTTSQGYNENDYNYAISRFEFVPGTTCEWETEQTFALKDGDRYNYPCIDLENRYVGNWTGTEMYIYDMDLLLAGEYALLTVVNVAFPFEGYDRKIGCGFDISGSYLYGGFYWEKGGKSGMYAVEFDLEGNVNNWTSIEYEPKGAQYYRELNGIKIERIDGENRLFVGLCTYNNDNKRYCPSISYFSERRLEPVAPTMESKPIITEMSYTALPQNAANTPWKCANGIFSVQSSLEQRLLFNDAAFSGELYSFETTVTMNGAEYAGIALAAATNVSNLDDLYSANTFIGLKITVSSSGVLKIASYGSSTTYNVSVGSSFKIKGTVSETGLLSVFVNGNKIAELQLPSAYIGGHVGCLAKGGTVSFTDTVLTYHQS